MRIEKLTHEQKSRLCDQMMRWTKIGLSTQPANHLEAEGAINRLYELAGLDKPEKIVWCDSPLSMFLTRMAVPADYAGDCVKNSVLTPVVCSLGSFIRKSVSEQVWDHVNDLFCKPVQFFVWKMVGNLIWYSVLDAVEGSVLKPVSKSIWHSIRDSIGTSVRRSVNASVGGTANVQIWSLVCRSVGDSIQELIRESPDKRSFSDPVYMPSLDCSFGQLDADQAGLYECFEKDLGLQLESAGAESLISLAKNAGWWLPHWKICWVSEKPRILERDELGRLHSLTGPAVEYPDGWRIYALHGIRVPANIIEKSDLVKIEGISNDEDVGFERVTSDFDERERYVVRTRQTSCYLISWMDESDKNQNRE